MNTDTQQTLDRIKADDKANDKVTDRYFFEIMRKHIHDNLDILPAETRRKLETVETMFRSAEDIYSIVIKECFLSLNTNRE